MSDPIPKELPGANISPVSSQETARVEHINVNEKLQGTQLSELAQHGEDVEHHLGAIAAIKAYPMAIFWSVMVSMCVVMEGYEYVGYFDRKVDFG